MPETPDALQRLLVALLVGLLIGLDRERAEGRKIRRLFAGIRTFPLISMLAAALSLVNVWLLALGFVAVGAIALISYQQTARQGEVGATTEVAALVTYALGALAGLGQLVVAGAVGVAVLVLLVTKVPMERLSRAMSEQELRAVLQLAVISAIVLPLLPDRGYGPWQVWNPFKIWMVVVLVSALSFAGFVAVRWKGEQAGLLWAAGLGALVSSTATTVAMAQRSREMPAHGRRIAAAALLASVVMCGRVMVLVVAVRPSLALRLAIPVGAMAAVGVAFVVFLGRGSDPVTSLAAPREHANPFSLRSAILFGAVFAGVSLLVKASDVWLGARGTWLAALLSGVVDVDAVTVTMARGATADGAAAAVTAIVLACISNDLFKTGAAIYGGAGRFRREVATGLVAMAVAGGAAVALLSLLL
jgi:uncharacterized membrane protein (DUF4010 family)